MHLYKLSGMDGPGRSRFFATMKRGGQRLCAGTQETFHFPAQVPPRGIQPGCLSSNGGPTETPQPTGIFHFGVAFHLIHQ